MLFEIDGQARPAPAGSFVFVPPGTVHAFQNPTAGPAAMLITFIPGGFEGFFERGKELGSPITDAASWKEINERWDVQVVGPPLDAGSSPSS